MALTDVESLRKATGSAAHLGMGLTCAGPTSKSEGAPKRRQQPLQGLFSHLCRHSPPTCSRHHERAGGTGQQGAVVVWMEGHAY